MDLTQWRETALRFFRAVQVGATQLAQMGDGDGNLLTGEPYLYWARMLNAPASDASSDPRAYTVVRVRCTRLQPFDKMYVRVAANPYDGVLEVVDVDHFTGAEFFKSLPGGLSGIYSPPHAWTHVLGTQGGLDVVWLDPRQVVLAQVRPTDPPSMSVVVEPYHYIYGGMGKFLPQTTLDLTSYRPSGAFHRLAIICLNPVTNAVTVVASTPVSTSGVFPAPPPAASFDNDDIAAVTVPPPLRRLAAVRLYGGQTTVDWVDILAALHEWGASSTGTGELRITTSDPTWGYLAAKLLVGQGLAVATDDTQAMTLSGIPDGWDSDAAPKTPSALDDEFNDSSLDVKWTEYDPLSVLALLESGTTLSCTVANAVAWSGLTQPLPAGDFTTVIKVTIPTVTLTADEQQLDIGLAVLEDPGDPDAAFMAAVYQQVRVSGTTFYAARGLSYPAGETGGLTLPAALTTAYLRLRRFGTTYHLDVSGDTAHWTVIDVSDYVDFTPTAVGILVSNESGASRVFGVDWCRYRSTDDGIDGLVYGQGPTAGGASDFLDLTDTPSSYTGQGGRVVSVKADESGLEFSAAGSGDMTKAVYDTNDDGTVNSAENADTVDGQHASAFAAASHTHTEDDITDLSHDAVKLQGRTLAATAPTNGQALVWNNTSSQWVPAIVGDMVRSVYDVNGDNIVDNAAYAAYANNAGLLGNHAPNYYAVATHTHAPATLLGFPHIVCGRWSINSSDPFYADDDDDDTAGSIYYHPVVGNLIALWDGTNWVLRTVSAPIEKSLTGVAAGMYDIYLSWVSSAFVVTLTPWTDNNTRNTSYEPIFTDGVETREDNKALRWVGTVLVVGSGVTRVNPRYCYLWNRDNQRLTKLAVNDTGTTGSGALAFQIFNADTTNQLFWVWGRNQTAICSFAGAVKAANAGAQARCGWSLNNGGYSEALDNQNTQTIQFGTTMPKGPAETLLGLNSMQMVQAATNGYTYGYARISVALMA